MTEIRAQKKSGISGWWGWPGSLSGQRGGHKKSPGACFQKCMTWWHGLVFLSSHVWGGCRRHHIQPWGRNQKTFLFIQKQDSASARENTVLLISAFIEPHTSLVIFFWIKDFCFFIYCSVAVLVFVRYIDKSTKSSRRPNFTSNLHYRNKYAQQMHKCYNIWIFHIFFILLTRTMGHSSVSVTVWFLAGIKFKSWGEVMILFTM